MAFVTAVRSYSVNTTENKFVVLVIVVVWTANIWKISYKKKTILSLEIVFVETFLFPCLLSKNARLNAFSYILSGFMLSVMIQRLRVYRKYSDLCINKIYYT